MNMFPSSAIQVIQQGTRLEIIDPPLYSAGGFIVFLSISLAAAFYGLQAKESPKLQFSWPVFILALVFFLIGLSLLTSSADIILARDTGTMTIRRSYFGIQRIYEVSPLASIRHATVERNNHGYRVVVLLGSGGTVALGRFTGQSGHCAAANAINDFLGQPKSR